MQKTYRGRGARRPCEEEVVVDWRCPHCRSGNVFMTEDEHYRNARWCDGGVTTHDEFGKWTCKSCGKSERGSRLIQVEISRMPISKQEKPQTSFLDRIINPPKEIE